MDNQTALIVDDSRLARLIIHKILLHYRPDWQVLEASNADEALALAEKRPVDFVTLDFNMPGMDGLTLAGKLRAAHPDARICLITANVRDDIREVTDALGIEFIGKPLTEEKLAPLVELSA